MWNIILLLVVCWRTTAGNNNIDICKNQTLTMNFISLQRNNQDSDTNCWCQITAENRSSTQVIFNVSSFIGQQYKLSVSNGTSTSYFENRMSPDIFYTINESEEIIIKLEKNNCSVNGIEFAISINSKPGRINITCHNPNVSKPELCTQITSEVTTTSTSTITTTGPVIMTSTASNTTTSTNTTTAGTTSTLATAPTGTYTSVEISTTTSQNEETTNSTATGDLVLIGGSVGGSVLLIILLLILIICLVRRKRRKKDGYDRPSSARLPPVDGYAVLDNSSPVGMVIEDNPVYHSSDNADSVSPRHIDTNQRSDDEIQMEIIENDLYVSSGDVMNFNETPEVEYAVVNKQRKTDKPSKETSVDSGVSMSSNEPNSDHDRKFVLGPQGDEYTLVTKT